MKMQILKLKIRFFVEGDGDLYHAYCPELKGVHAAGDTENEAMENAIAAAKAYLDIIVEHNDPIPLGAIESSNYYTFTDLFKLMIGKIISPPPRHSYTRELTIGP